MGVFKHRSKSRNIYYAGFGIRGQYFVRSLGTSNRREAERREKRLRSLAEAGRLPLKVSAEERAEQIKKSLAIPAVSRIHRASVRAAAKKRDRDPEKRKGWIAAIKAGQDDPKVKARMAEASRETAANPVSVKRKKRSLKKMWKRRGHRYRVSKGLRKTLATPESKERRRAGRERWARELLGVDQAIPQSQGREKPPRKRGPQKSPFPNTKSFRIGEEIAGLAAGKSRTDARKEIARKYGFEFDTVRRYDQKYLRHIASKVG